MRVPALPTFFCLLSPDFQRLRAELIRVLARYPPGTGGSRCRLPPGGIEGSHRDRRVGRENDRRASGRPVEGSPRPWLRATDNHGYRRLACWCPIKMSLLSTRDDTARGLSSEPRSGRGERQDFRPDFSRLLRRISGCVIMLPSKVLTGFPGPARPPMVAGFDRFSDPARPP